MQSYWTPHAEETIRRLCANPQPDIDPRVLGEAVKHGALPVGWDLWSHFYLKPDGTLLRIGIELETGNIEIRTDRSHVLWGLVMGSERYPELNCLLPERPPAALDCECINRPAQLARVFCPLCGGVRWLPP